MIRPATAGDRPAVLALLRRSLGVGDDPRYERFFSWKHDENAFGPSYEWVAVEDETVVGYRAFLRWEFVVDGEVVRAVRAVDTATHPDHRGKGIFRALTLHAVEAMTADGAGFVFNTPNDQSRPGYLTMGWEVVGRLPVAVRPLRARALWRMARARVPAARWSLPTEAFEPPAALEDVEVPSAPGWSTNRTPAYLTWRYGLDDLAYRVVRADGEAAVLRLRERGPLVEATIAEAWGETIVARLPRLLRTATSADVAVRIGGPLGRAITSGGPTLTWRALARHDRPSLDAWSLTTGDIELF